MKKTTVSTILLLFITLLVNIASIQDNQANDNLSKPTATNKIKLFKVSANNDSINQLLTTVLIAVLGVFIGWVIAFNYYRHIYKKTVKNEYTKLKKSGINQSKVNRSKKNIESYPEIYIKQKNTSPYILHIEQAYKFLDKGDTQKALKNLNEAIRIKPDSARVYSERANFRKNKLGDKQGAIEDYSKAIAINPNDAFLYFWRSHTYQELGNQKRAIEDYNAAIKIAPEDILYYSFDDYKK